MFFTRTQLRGLRILLAIAMGVLAWRYYRNPARISDPMPAEGPLSSQLPARIDPNTADAATLATIPGLSQSLAQRIVEFRQSHPSPDPGQPIFRAPDDLRQIKGIGPATVETITPYLSFGLPEDP